MQKHVMPEVGVFCHSSYRHKRRTPAHLKSIRRSSLTNQQAQHLGVRSHTTESVSRVVLFSECQCITSMLRKMSSCLQVSKLPQNPAAVVHRQTFEMPEVKQFVEELSVDGVASALPRGTLHLAIQGCACTTLRLSAYFQDNDALIEWVNHQTCLTNHLFRGWA